MIDVVFLICIFLIAYVYVCYPVLLAILARVFPRKKSANSSGTPTVTLLIAAHNEAATIQQKLENSLSLDYPPAQLQIVVAADGSDDGTVAIVEQYAERGVVLSYQPERCGKMTAINRAMALAQGEIVVFSDANNVYDSAVLQELVRPFMDGAVGGVSGAKTIVKGDGPLGSSEGLYWKYESFIKQKETQLGSCVGAAGEVFAIRRHLFEAPPSDVINDDLYMALRLIQRGICAKSAFF
jgi:biofilm PGA synthesis N-glycosyltransferase PgaC